MCFGMACLVDALQEGVKVNESYLHNLAKAELGEPCFRIGAGTADSLCQAVYRHPR